jgi:nitroimidazol reductase NimA-like FMN-containing flavoprotein (pyridoxamine 5'-phosphate oxidase superfamily)
MGHPQPGRAPPAGSVIIVGMAPVESENPAGGTPEPSPASERVRLRRKRERGSHDRVLVDAILDEGLVAHLGICDADGQPLVIPTLHARRGDVVYCHGSAVSRTLRALRAGTPACLTVTLLDGIVLARSVMHHSANYRSAMILGTATEVSDPQEKLDALRAIVEHIVPGRWEHARHPTESEMKATAVLSIPITEFSAKVRTGPPLDDEEDYALGFWAGVIPMEQVPGPALPDPRLADGIPTPGHASGYRRPGSPRPRR